MKLVAEYAYPNAQETVRPHIPCGCYQMKQTLNYNRYDLMQRPLYYSVLEKYEFSECRHSQPWYKQSSVLRSMFGE